MVRWKDIISKLKLEVIQRSSNWEFCYSVENATDERFKERNYVRNIQNYLDIIMRFGWIALHNLCFICFKII